MGNAVRLHQGLGTHTEACGPSASPETVSKLSAALLTILTCSHLIVVASRSRIAQRRKVDTLPAKPD